MANTASNGKKYLQTGRQDEEMPYILGDVPYFRCLARKEYTRDLADGHGEYIPGVAHAVRCVRGDSLWFQVNFKDPYGGCAYLLPIQALCWKPCEVPETMQYTQPWDVFSPHFTVVELAFVRRSLVHVLPGRLRGEYRFTIDFTGTDLADDPAQHKAVHLCFLENGLIGAFPNNRLLWTDTAFWDVREERPDFDVLNAEFRAEGFPARQRETIPDARKATREIEEEARSEEDRASDEARQGQEGEALIMAESAPVTHYRGAPKKKPAAKKPASKARPKAKAKPKARVGRGR